MGEFEKWWSENKPLHEYEMDNDSLAKMTWQACEKRIVRILESRRNHALFDSGSIDYFIDRIEEERSDG